MRKTPVFALRDEAELRRLIAQNPWITLVGHVGRPEERLHELGQHEVMVVVQGPHGYISPSWYDADPAVPTWNFTAAHLSGVPEILDAAENSAYADAISAGTVGFRLVPTRIEAKTKLSQNKPEATVDRIISELEGDGPYASDALAAEMRRARCEK